MLKTCCNNGKERFLFHSGKEKETDWLTKIG